MQPTTQFAFHITKDTKLQSRMSYTVSYDKLSRQLVPTYYHLLASNFVPELIKVSMTQGDMFT